MLGIGLHQIKNGAPVYHDFRFNDAVSGGALHWVSGALDLLPGLISPFKICNLEAATLQQSTCPS